MSLGNFSPDLFRKAQDVQKGLAQLREDLEDRVVEANSGGGLVTAYANGNGNVVKVRIQPDAVDPDDAVRRVEETQQQIGQRTLAATVGADDGHGFARRYSQIDPA